MKFVMFFVATNSLVAADSGSIRSADKYSSEGSGSEVSGRADDMCNNCDAFLCYCYFSLIHFHVISSYYSICRDSSGKVNARDAILVLSACLVIV